MIAAALAAVRERLARAAARAGRDPGDVRLVAVSKTQPAEVLRAAFEAGVSEFGENKVQEAESKLAALGDLRPRLRLHLVGHLQSNKARRAAALFDTLHSLDRLELAGKLDQAAEELGREQLEVLVQVDLAREPTKHGVPPEDLWALLEGLRRWRRLRVGGLMVLPPLSAEAEASRPYFRRLRELRDQAQVRGLLDGGQLSMGMSHDYEVAIEEGATLVRVGTAVFGERGAPGRSSAA